jgi:anti-sigma B factor antagonist
MLQQIAHRCLETEQLGQTTVATFTARSILDDATIQELGHALFRLAGQIGPGSLLLNFSAVERLSSNLIGKLIGVRRKVQEDGGQIALCGLNPELSRLFTLMNLNQLMPMYSDEQQALQSL